MNANGGRQKVVHDDQTDVLAQILIAEHSEELGQQRFRILIQILQGKHV